VRVIAGRWGGRRLKAPKGRATRPTSERVREAIFSMLGTVAEEEVLDLFAGTGALGIEALSRGAKRAVFVERDRGALEALRGNLEVLGLQASEAEVRPGEAFGALGSARARAETYDLVLIDPPYRRTSDLGRELSSALASLLAPQARVVVESDRRAPLELPWEIVKERRYGDTSITIHRFTDDH
jgi:16S rRNA (guanine966-N2)-methyltransferase